MRYTLSGKPVNSATFWGTAIFRVICMVIGLVILTAVLPFSAGQVFMTALAVYLLICSYGAVLHFSDGS